MTPETGQKIAYLMCFVVISAAVTGYFVGLQSPMNPLTSERKAAASHQPTSTRSHDSAMPNRMPGTDGKLASLDHHPAAVVLATHYADMHTATLNRSKNWRTNLADLKPNADPLAEVKITPEQKSFALALRDQNRAFNGAPPTIPHPVEQMSAQACMACHGDGVSTETLRISKMSHQFLTNCTQCHVENNPQRITATLFRENSFVGLPAPTGGPRAYQGAPPMIPHSTWMRVECMSCHGFAGQQGIRTTHPWRQNCQQCHAPSSELDQTLIETQPNFLEPLKIK